LNLVLGIGEKNGSAVGGRALGQAVREGALPVGARAERFVLQVQGGVIRDQRQLLVRHTEGRPLALDQLKGEADQRDGDKAGQQKRHEAAKPLIVG
jgi:hypothetical protein